MAVRNTSAQSEQQPEPASVHPWPLPSRVPALGRDDVHVWRAPLDVKALLLQALQQTLSSDEQVRADRFHFQRDREHFIVSRGLLRTILGRYLGMEPSRLQFCYGRQGKPALESEPGRNAVSFNISHSAGIALFAFTRGRRIGVDIERIRNHLADGMVAERFFSPREVAVLRGLPEALQPEAFFNCWTRKEAYIKARGDGLFLLLDSFDVSLAPGEPAVLLSTKGDPHEASRWSLQKLDPGADYVAALAVEGRDWRLKCWRWAE